MSTDQRYKVILVGAGGVGKTQFVTRHHTGNFDTGYIPTLNATDAIESTQHNVYSLTFQTNYGPIVFDVYDTAGLERCDDLYNEMDAIIGFFDVTRQDTLHALNAHIAALTLNRWPHTVVCGSKCDIKVCCISHGVTNEQKRQLLSKWGAYYDVSSKSNYNYDAPFLYLARALTGHKDLSFTVI